MAIIANRRASIVLFSGASDMYSHRVRLVLAEKAVEFDCLTVEPGERQEDLIELNPYNEVPTLVDRELALYDSLVIMNYLDERFVHPPLMPVDPVNRATQRLLLYRIQRDLCNYADLILSGTEKQAAKARKDLRDNLVASEPAFAARPYFLSDDFGLVDCIMLPLLWRLPVFGIDLPKQAAAVQDYMDRLFSRESFKASLSENEQEMR
ncbi:MAG: glutathione S-transferase N-terminal domain-containing protein [Thiohalomonadaceae bacterium]